jgi:hypothetical protein
VATSTSVPTAISTSRPATPEVIPAATRARAAANDAAQDLSLLNGKILRLDRFTGAPAPGNPLTALGAVVCGSRGNGPATPGTWCQELYAWGLRNPFRFAFDPAAATTRFFVNDVGQGTREEVNDGFAGANYGWNAREGRCPRGQQPPCAGPPAGVTDPIVDYPRSVGTFITAGAFVPPGVWPALTGAYLFADGGAGKVWVRTADGAVDFDAPILTGAFGLADMAFVTEPTGPSLYYTLNGSSEVRRLRLGALTAGGTLELQVTGVGGVPVDASAVALNVTVVNARAAGFATVYPCGLARPEASNVNFAVGQTIANVVIARPGSGGRVCVFSDATVDVLADVAGFFPAGSDFAPSSNPVRILDTRNGIGAPVGLLGAGGTLELGVTGVGGVPVDASAVALNVTVVGARAAGFATVYPCGLARPEASNVNFAVGQTIANVVIARPGSGGRVCVFSDATVDVLADVAGFFPAGSDFAPSSNPVRILDTRNGIGAPVGLLGAGGTLELGVTGVGGVPVDASAVALNVTVVGARAAGFATVYPCGLARPEASNVNFAVGQTIANVVIARPGSGGRVCVFSDATVDVLADVAGFFPAGSDFAPSVNPVRILDTRNGIGV